MSRQYTEISQQEMHDFLTGLGFTKHDAPNTLDGLLEVSYERYFTNGRLIIWTSLNHRRKQAGRGADAIRIVVHKAERFHKMSHTKRLANWKETLRNKIGTAIVKYRLTNPGLSELKLSADHPATSLQIPTSYPGYGDHVCAYCGDPNVNGETLDGQKVCAYHEVQVRDHILCWLFGDNPNFMMAEGI